MIKEISVKELKQKLDNKDDLQLIDVREADEKQIADIGGELIPLSEISAAPDRVARDKPVVIYCRSGGRSMRACQALASQHGFTNLINLTGGILAWADEIDPKIQKY